MNTKTIPHPLGKRVKRARRKYLQLNSRCMLNAGPARRRAFRAQIAFALAYNIAAKITGAELISGLTLRPHHWARHEGSHLLQTPPLVQR